MNLHQYTHELIDEIVKIANLDSLVRHKIIRRIHNFKPYKEYKNKDLTIRKARQLYRKTAVIPFRNLPNKIKSVMLFACEKYDLDIITFCSNSRKREVVDAQRNVIFYLHKDLKYSCGKVAGYFMKDHSTILHACKVHQDRMDVDKMYGRIYNAIKYESDLIIFESEPQPIPE